MLSQQSDRVIERVKREVLMSRLTREMVSPLVDHTDDIQVRANEVSGVVQVHVRVAHRDVGRIIGRDGRTASSLRTILGCAATKIGVRCDLAIETTEMTVRVGPRGVSHVTAEASR